MNLREIKSIWKKVFGNWRYLFLAIFIAFSFYLFNVLLNSWSSLTNFYSLVGLFQTLRFFFILSLGFFNVIKIHSFISLIIISVLLGILFSLVLYKSNAGSVSKNKKAGVFGSIGIFLAALAPGCAACGIGLLSILGLSAAVLTSLPFDGLELSILSMGILSFSIFKITKEMKTCSACQIKLNNNERRYIEYERTY